MKEVELMKKLYVSYKKKCPICNEEKYTEKFKRGDAIRWECNDCYIRSMKKGEIDDKF